MRSANFCLSSCKIIICNLIDVLIHDKESLYLGVCIGWKKVSLMNIINVFFTPVHTKHNCKHKQINRIYLLHVRFDNTVQIKNVS